MTLNERNISPVMLPQPVIYLSTTSRSPDEPADGASTRPDETVWDGRPDPWIYWLVGAAGIVSLLGVFLTDGT